MSAAAQPPLPVPRPSSPEPAVIAAEPADLLAALRLAFSGAGLWMLLDRPAGGQAVVLAGAGLDPVPPTIAVPDNHPLFTAIAADTPLLLQRGPGAPDPLLELPQVLMRGGRTYRIWPLELLAIPLGEGRLVVRGAWEPAQRTSPAEHLLARLLCHPATSADTGGWLGDLARALFGTDQVEERIRIALQALVARCPGLQVVFWEADLSYQRVRLRGCAPDAMRRSDWEVLPDRWRDALAQNRPLINLEPAQDAWIAAVPAPLDLPQTPHLLCWPLPVPTGLPLILLAGHADSAALAPLPRLLMEWGSVVVRALSLATQLAQLRAEGDLRRQELGIAANIQRSLLPEDQEWGRWELAVYHATDRELAGDFVLIDPDPQVLHLAIGDVAGRGIPASLTMMAAYSLLLAQIGRGGPLVEILSRWSAELNRLTERNQARGGDLSYTTAVLLRLDPDTGQVEAGKAGHPYPLHYHAATGEVRQWDAMGYPAGLFAEQEFELIRQELAPGDALVLYTDGFSEAGIGEGQFGIDRLSGLLAAFGVFPAPVLKDQLLRALAEHLHGAPVGDDTTLVVVTRTQGEWETAENAALMALADRFCASTGWPAAEPVVAELAAGLAALQSALPGWLGSLLPQSWTLRWNAGPSCWQGALRVPGIADLLPGGDRPSTCLALCEDPSHPLRGFARQMDFVWTSPSRSELRFLRYRGAGS